MNPSYDETAEELYEMAPCGYVSTTPDGYIRKANRAFIQWTGYERQELIPKMRFQDVLTIGGKIYYETHLSLLLRIQGEANEIALDLLGKNGQVTPALVTATQKRDNNGKPILNRITVFNATERRMYEQELLEAKRRSDASAAELLRLNAQLSLTNSALLKANEQLGQFTFAASHDLQEPLRTITAFVQLLAKRYQNKLDPEAEKFIGFILDGTNRMHNLVSDLLAFSLAQSSELMLRTVELEQILAVAISNLCSAIDETGASITHDKLPQLCVDASRMAQLFQNLIGNAIKYSRPGEPPRVHISAEHRTSEWTFTVSDNGMGFEKAYAEQIFGMFKRLHGSDIPGTGIGLAICRKIVEAHNGRIWAESTPGVGTTFSFTIPERPPV